MRKLLVMATLLMATSAAGQWDGWPLKANTNASTWTEANKNYAPISQLWYAAQERYVAAPGFYAYGGVLPGQPARAKLYYTLPAGTNLSYTTNNGIVYTNILLVTTNITVSYSFDGSSSNYGDVVYSYTDMGGTHTATGKPGLNTRSQDVGGDISYTILQQVEWMLTYGNEDSDRTMNLFVSTNPAVGGTYNAYLSTSVTGAYPTAFLGANPANLYYYENIGFATNLTTNIWGWVTGSSNYNFDMAYSVNPPRTQNWTLAESHYTGSWTFVDVGAFPGASLRETELRPSWNYITGGTNQISSIPFLITGTVWSTWYYGYTVNAWRPIRATVATSETVTVTGSNGVLSGEWRDITGISSASSGANTTDVFVVNYTNVPTAYISGAPFTYTVPFSNAKLYAENLDDFKRLINAMQWTDAGTLSWTADSANNQYVWTGISTNDWLEAVGACETSTPAVATANSLAESGTEGVCIKFIYPNISYRWTATATARKSKLVTPALPTNTEHQINWYIRGTTNDIGTYDDFGYGVSNGFYRLFSTNAPTSDSIVTQAVGIGSTSFPPTWCDEPFDGTNTARGYKVNGQLGLSKWLFEFRD